MYVYVNCILCYTDCRVLVIIPITIQLQRVTYRYNFTNYLMADIKVHRVSFIIKYFINTETETYHKYIPGDSKCNHNIII